MQLLRNHFNIPFLLLLFFFVLTGPGCTPEPMGRGLWIAQGNPSETSATMQRNAMAVEHAAHGDYDRALETLPIRTEEAAANMRTRGSPVEENRETLAYWRLRKAFAGAFVAPDSWIAYSGSIGHVTTPTGRLTQMNNAIDAELGGFGLVIPVNTAWRELSTGERENETVYGDTLLRFTYFAGRAGKESWHDTKVAFGARMALPTGRERYRTTSLFNPFVRVGQVVGPLAFMVGTDAQLFAGENDTTGLEQSLVLRMHVLAHLRFMPILTASSVLRFGGGQTGTGYAGFGSGIRIFLDPLDVWQLEATTIGLVRFDGAARGENVSVWLSRRF